MKTKKQNTEKNHWQFLLNLLEATSNEKLLPCEKAVFIQYCRFLNFNQPVNVLVGKQESEKLFSSVISKLKENNVLPNLKDKELFLNAPLKIHGLSTRLYHSLKSMDCETMNDVLKHNEKDFFKVRGFGKILYNELMDYLLKCNLLYTPVQRSIKTIKKFHT